MTELGSQRVACLLGDGCRVQHLINFFSLATWPLLRQTWVHGSFHCITVLLAFVHHVAMSNELWPTQHPTWTWWAMRCMPHHIEYFLYPIWIDERFEALKTRHKHDINYGCTSLSTLHNPSKLNFNSQAHILRVRIESLISNGSILSLEVQGVTRCT